MGQNDAIRVSLTPPPSLDQDRSKVKRQSGQAQEINDIAEIDGPLIKRVEKVLADIQVMQQLAADGLSQCLRRQADQPQDQVNTQGGKKDSNLVGEQG